MIPLFLKLNDCEETRHLLRRPGDFALLALIALRARRRSSQQVGGLDAGEAYIGDLDAVGLTPRSYRTAKDRLAKDGLAAFRTTNRGTIGKLTSTAIFIVLGVNDDEQERPAATEQRHATDRKKTTNKEEEPERKKSEQKRLSPLDAFLALVAQDQFSRLDVPELRAIYADWSSHRQQLRKPLTAKAVELDARYMLKVLECGGVPDIKLRMEQAISRGWQGWYFTDRPQAAQMGPTLTGTRPPDDPMKGIMEQWTGG